MAEKWGGTARTYQRLQTISSSIFSYKNGFEEDIDIAGLRCSKKEEIKRIKYNPPFFPHIPSFFSF